MKNYQKEMVSVSGDEDAFASDRLKKIQYLVYEFLHNITRKFV